MRTLAELVEVLTINLSPTAERPVPPLLRQLREAVAASTGATVSGASLPAERSAMNMEAFTVWEDLTGRIDALFQAGTDLRPSKSPDANLLAWYVALSAARARGNYTAAQITLQDEHLVELLTGWVARIEALFDPPRIIEIVAACPMCGARYATTGEGELKARVSALYAAVVGGEVAVGCRSCATTWTGDQNVIGMARAAGIALDVDKIRDARTIAVEEVAPGADGTIRSGLWVARIDLPRMFAFVLDVRGEDLWLDWGPGYERTLSPAAEFEPAPIGVTGGWSVHA